jgi:heme/copper-type cytochrome/quinol oxidase subunit 3
MAQRDYFGDKLTAREREARQAEREAKQRLENRRLGILVFQISWMMAFLALVMVNWQLRFQYTSWPPPNVQAMGVLLPTIATGLLLAGVAAARRALRRAEAADLRGFVPLWTTALITGVLFCLIMAYEWWAVAQVDVEGTQYRAVFRLMTGFHLLHALTVTIFIGMGLNTQPNPTADAGDTWAIEATVKLWDFVFAAWLLFYVVLYWWRSG